MTNKNMTIKFFNIFLTGAAALVIACGGAQPGGGSTKTAKVDEDGKQILSEKAKEDFKKVADEYKAAEQTGWDAAKCDKMADHFEEIASKHGMPDAAFNVGVIYDRCGKRDKARAAFQDAINKYGSQHIPTKQRSIAYLAYFDILDGKEAASEEKLRQCVGLGRNTLEAVPCYTIAATILRNRAVAGDKEAWAKAQKNLRTALAIDAKYMPALYQLARLYYSIAVTLKKDSYLTLATLVVDQAKKTDPEFAPIYLVLGQILLQKNELVEALKAFERAFQKDPNFYEAYMAFAAINLNFRGYEDAKRAFEKAVALRPDSYDAHMGLGVAARGLGDYKLARSEYQKASEIDKTRTDYIFNIGVLEMDYENQGSIAEYEKAAAVFEKFISQATAFHKKDPDGKGPQESWVAKAEKRITNAKNAVKQIKEAERQMAEMKRLAEEQAKREKEMAELARQAEELAKKEAEGQQAKSESVDEAAIEKELAEEEAKKKEEAKAEKEEAKKAEEVKKKETKDSSGGEEKEAVKL